VISPDLADRLREGARAPVLLVASDYDGTLSPIVEDPDAAKPVRESIVALRALAAMPQTHVAVISGRALSDLARLTGEPEEVHLVGSHGSEFDPDFAARLSRATVALRERVASELEEIARRDEGFQIERKPASIAFHYRNVDRPEAERALRDIAAGPASFEGVFTKHGKEVVELGVVSTNKGQALDAIRGRVGASMTVFLGDDITDEDAFATLWGPDIGVKVGDGETCAAHRIADVNEVARLLAQLAEERGAWLAGSDAVPIERHSLLSDQRTVALVTPEARITWMCAARIDSPSVFAELLGGPTAGYFAVRPEAAEPPLFQEYQGDSVVLRTKWRDMEVTDFLDCSDARAFRRAGRVDLVRVLRGTGKAIVDFAPRLDFGRTPTRIVVREEGLEIQGSIDPIVLRAPGVRFELHEDGMHQRAVGEVELDHGAVFLELRYGTGDLKESVLSEGERRRQTESYWSRWADHLVLPRTHRAAVRSSALAIKALCHGPTGAIAAAGTTSLPEAIGGVRNWDYRFCWPRDAAMAAASLARLGSTGEANDFLDWILGVLDREGSPETLAPVYTVGGGELGPEGAISELAGYSGSRPVRVGNAASRQVQLDVFGPIVDLIWVLLERGAPLSGEHWRLVKAMVEAVEQRWREPDHGIWEVRTAPRQHVHSKVMCWLTLDRAERISERFLARTPDGVARLRDEIAADVLAHGVDSDMGVFRSHYDADGADGSELDAAVLHVGLAGLVPPTDDRFVRTVEAVNRELRSGPAVYRYRYEDGLPGREGAFNICTCWLIQALALIGRADEARELLDAYVGLAGPTGLMAEEYDPHERRALGNFPQVYSHVGLIDAVLAVEAASHSPIP